jgi:acyl-CoA synthetase (NDP forming)
MKDLKCIFQPHSVAFIGATSTTDPVGRALFSNILYGGFNAADYPVNTRHKNIVRVGTYLAITAIRTDMDLAMICIPANVVKKVAQQCILKEVKGAVISMDGKLVLIRRPPEN